MRPELTRGRACPSIRPEAGLSGFLHLSSEHLGEVLLIPGRLFALALEAALGGCLVGGARQENDGIGIER